MSDDASAWHCYRHSGLVVRSQLALPEWEAFEAKGSVGDADVTIQLRQSVSEEIEESLPTGDRNTVEFSVGGLGRWRISTGQEIAIEPAQNADPRAIRLFTHGSAWGAIGYQRGLAMLHGSAVQLDECAMLFGGVQEQGKSTMAAAMLAHGAKLVSDDLARIDPGGDERARIYRSSTRLKLWQAAIDRFELQDRVIAQDLFREEKFHTEAGHIAGDDPIPLKAIILLEWGDEVSIEMLSGGEAVRAVLHDTCYRPEMLDVMGRTAEQAALVSQIVGSTAVYRLTRPRDFARLDEAREMVELI
ncbi:hypothetical protein [Altererythrobacter sp. MF3-039]|uniref:hypothetical protein n=1 Tax=Altererythrobacter sp. MF3-039 TaxID=3252901 RepID=UPI00390CD591